MEALIGMAAGYLVVFLCLFCLRYGYKAGKAEKEGSPLPPMVEKSEKKDLAARQAKEREEAAKRPIDPRAAWLGWNGDNECQKK